VDANSPIKNLPFPPFFFRFPPFFFSLPPFFSLIPRRPFFFSLPLVFFSHPAQTPLLSLALFFSFSSSSPSFSLSLTLSSVDRSVSQSLSLRQNHLRPSLSPSGNTPTGISSASPSISSPQVCDLLFCYHVLIPLLSVETLTNSQNSPSLPPRESFGNPSWFSFTSFARHVFVFFFFSISALKFVNFLMQL
jgi:hypothetical protein